MTQAAVEIDTISYSYPGSSSPALDRVSLRVEDGERLGILGPNGGGKSTLLKIILGLVAPTSGRVMIFGRAPEQARREGIIGYVAQKTEIETGLPMSVREAVTLGAAWRARPWRATPRSVRQQVNRVLALVGCEEYADRPIGRLSGGQLQRALIARALAADVRILALDEPTVGIDASGQERFAELLDSVHRELKLTTLIVSHDLRAIVAGSDRVACLARRLHSHTSPEGLTPQILAELFTHDVAGLKGSLRGMHVHAHGSGEPCAEIHLGEAKSGRVGESGGLVQLGVPSRPAQEKPRDNP